MGKKSDFWDMTFLSSVKKAIFYRCEFI